MVLPFGFDEAGLLFPLPLETIDEVVNEVLHVYHSDCFTCAKRQFTMLTCHNGSSFHDYRREDFAIKFITISYSSQ